jgi:HK97 family phage major capsid protein/HK97 family phage prohead protease
MTASRFGWEPDDVVVTPPPKEPKKAFDPSEPRDESGKWTDGGGDDGGGEHPGEGYSKGAYVDKHGVIQTTKVADAQRALSENRKVNLDQPKKISTLIKALASEARKMIERGKEAPNFNLCNVSVAGTNLFCEQSKGIPRAQMPQLDEDQTKALIQHLKDKGYEVKKENEYASHLRATQDELSSAKVAKITEKAKTKPDKLAKRLVISKDDYILDGHHHWATKLGLDAADDNLTNDTKMRVSRVNIGIVQLLKEAEKFSGPHKTVSDKALEAVTMAIKPGKGESQSDWMSRCVPDMMGTHGGTKRPQEQAVAACFQMWRDKDKKKQVDPPRDDEDFHEFLDRCIDEGYDDDECVVVWETSKLIGSNGVVHKSHAARRKQGEPSPNDNESFQDFMERCTDEGFGEDECQVLFEEARSVSHGIVHKTHAAPVTEMEFVLSDETVDRMGEIVSSDGWDIASFQKNPIALFSHDPRFPIGKWHDLRVEGKALRGRLQLAPEGTSERIDEIRRLIDADILKAVSVGFRPTQSEPLDPENRGLFAPQRYIKQELVECSLVSVPANPNALAVVKALKISPATVDLVFAKHGNRDQTRRLGLVGKHARTSHTGRGKDTMSSLAQRIIDVETKLVDRKDQLSAHWMKTDETNVSDADLEISTGLNAEIAQLDKQLASLVESEKLLAKTVDGNSGHVSRSRALATSTSFITPHEAVGAEGIARAQPNGQAKPDFLDCVVRAATVAWAAKSRNRSFEEARQQIAADRPQYNEDNTKLMCDLVLRAASAPAMTTVAGWAAELVQQVYTDLMPLLMPHAIMTRLAARGLALSFGRAGRIIIPTRSRTPTIAGSFVGEGQAIPVRQGAFTSQTLTPKKMAVITTFTKEMEDHSIPAIEGILRDAIQTDTSVAVDSVLIDANPATTVRPPGLLNGVSVTTATAGGGLAALIGDIKVLIQALVASTYGNVRSPVFLMNPGDVLAASLVSAVNTGIFPFRDEVARGTLNGVPIIDSATVPVKTMILVDAADFVVAGGEAPRIDMSDQATLHMEDTTPLDLVGPGSPGTVAAPQRSLFQTDSLALRMILPLNWVQRRAGTIAWTQNITWA